MIAHSLTLRSQATLATGERMLLDLPDCDHDEFLEEVDTPERARVRELFVCFREILAARNLKAGARSAALKRHHLGRGWDDRTLLKLFCAYRDGGHKPGDWRKEGPIYSAGDWRILLRGYKPGTPAALPEEFKRWLCEQWATFKGRTDIVTATWRHVVYELWLKGAPVPGYGSVDAWCKATGRARPHPQLVRPGELPAGWTVATFRRALPKRTTTRKALAHGYLAAHASQPDQVLTDRGPLLPLQYVFLDDSRPDFRCTWFGPLGGFGSGGGRGEIVYPLLVMGLDACSGVDLEAVTKPRALRDQGTTDQGTKGPVRHGVTQDMALRVVVGVLRRLGLPPWPICFVHELAAACVPSEAKHLLHGVYGDRIQFMSTGLFKERMTEHGFTDQGGAPYDKAPIEAFWRILMCQLARLPGSTGPRYDTAPGELKQIEKYTLGLIEKAARAAGSEEAAIHEVFQKFRSPLLDWPEADAAMMAALRLLRFRTHHKLQGFDRVREWRRSPADQYRPWHDFLALPAGDQEAINAGGDIISRLECPAERFCRKLQGVELTPVDDDLLTYIEGPRQPVMVRDGKITLRDTQRFGDDDLIFRESDHPLLGEEYERRKFEAAVARDGSRIVLTQEGQILGSVARQGRVVRGTDEWRREAGRVSKSRVADRQLLREYYLADTDEALAEMRAHNAVVTPAALAEAKAATLNAERSTLNAQVKQTTATKKNNTRRALQMAAMAQPQAE